MPSGLTYYEIFDLGEDVTNEEEILEAYSKAQRKWQTLLNQGIGEKAKLARQIMDGELQAAYDVLLDPTKRQEYKRSLDLKRNQQQAPLPSGSAQAHVEVNFSLDTDIGDYTFMVVENPVRHPLRLANNLEIESIQEYICRALENFELGLETFNNRSLERWVHYSAGAADLADAIKYMKWKHYRSAPESLFRRTLELLQTHYPVPILPKSPAHTIEQTAAYRTPQWNIVPSVANLGLIPQTGVSVPVFIRTWKRSPGKVSLMVDNPLINTDTSRLASEHQFTVRVDGAELKRGDVVRGNVLLHSETYGEANVPVIGARHRMIGNASFAREVNFEAAQIAFSLKDYETATRLFRLTGLSYERQSAELELIRMAQRNHDWQELIEKAREFHTQYGLNHETLTYLVEALRVRAASHYQLAQYTLTLPYLTSLAYETARLPNGKLPADNWSVQASAQIRIDPENPQKDWVTVAEKLNLRWTQAGGSAEQSRYAGPTDIDLRSRKLIWQTTSGGFAPPLIAYEGVLVARTVDQRAIVGIGGATGQPLWQHTHGLTGQPIAVPVAGNGAVFLTDPSGVLYSLDIVSGKLRWQVQLPDGIDLSLSLADELLYVGTASQVMFIHTRDGSIHPNTDLVRDRFSVGSNPVNMLVTDGCCVMQKSLPDKNTLLSIDMENGNSIEFDLPLDLKPPVTWAAYAGEVYLPAIVTNELRCKQWDAEGRLREKTEMVWDSLHLAAYGVRSSQIIVDLQTPLGKYPAEISYLCDIRRKAVQVADACAVAPVYSEVDGDKTIISPPKKGQRYEHRLIAAAFGKDVYYWLATEKKFSKVGRRQVDDDVLALLFAHIHDVAVTSTSFSTSLVGNTAGARVSTYILPDEVRPIVGSPALYGDLIYIVSKTGQIAAIGR